MSIRAIGETGTARQIFPKGTPEDKSFDDKLLKACREFESLFLTQILQSMRKGLPESGLLGDGKKREILESHFDRELGRILAQTKGLGLGEMLYKQFSRAGQGKPSPSLVPAEIRSADLQERREDK